MQLILTVQNVEVLTGATRATHTFTGQGGTIGRGAGATWRIEDKPRFISGIHGEVSLIDGAFCYTDRSKNGSLVNGAKVSMSWNEAVRFSDGDTMTLGQVNIAVQLIDTAQSAGQDAGHRKSAPAVDAANRARPVEHIVPEQGGAKADASILEDGPPFGEIQTQYEIATKSADPLSAIEASNHRLVGVVDPMQAFGREETANTAQDEALVKTPGQREVDQEALRDLSGTTADAFGAGETRGQDVEAGLDSYLRALEAGDVAGDAASRIDGAAGEPLDHIALAPLGRGLGYDVSRVDREGADLLLEEVGEALSAAVDKLWTLSQVSAANGPLSRRLAETKLYPHEDNPLRFSKSADAALKALFDRTNPVQLSAGAAVAETLTQVARHQEMSEKSIDQALELVFAAMSPAFMKRRFAAYASGRKRQSELSPAECWGLYERYFAELKSDRQTGLRRLFWQIFDRRYDELAREASLDLTGD